MVSAVELQLCAPDTDYHANNTVVCGEKFHFATLFPQTWADSIDSSGSTRDVNSSGCRPYKNQQAARLADRDLESSMMLAAGDHLPGK